MTTLTSSCHFFNFSACDWRFLVGSCICTGWDQKSCLLGALHSNLGHSLLKSPPLGGSPFKSGPQIKITQSDINRSKINRSKIMHAIITLKCLKLQKYTVRVVWIAKKQKMVMGPYQAQRHLTKWQQWCANKLKLHKTANCIYAARCLQQNIKRRCLLQRRACIQ